MKNFDKKYWQAVAVMIGYIIGVGMFGLPFVFYKAGVLVFFIYIISFGLLQYLLHLIYANIIIVTEGYHRLPGFTEKYLGARYKPLAFMCKILGNIGALLAYIIISGIFLETLLAPIFGGSDFFYSTLLFAIAALIVFFGIKTIARSEFIMSGLLVVVVVLISAKGLPVIELDNFLLWDWKMIFLPYGAMLMALDGNGSLPIVANILNKDKDKMKSVVRTGTLLSAIIIFVFTLVVIGISGVETSTDALAGIKSALNGAVIKFSLVFGVLTIFTSIILVAESVKEALWWDYNFNKKLAWAFAIFIPYLLYSLGIKDLISVISFVGGAAGGLSAIILILIIRKLMKDPAKLLLLKRPLPGALLFFLVGLFCCGIMYEIYFFIIHNII